MLRTGILGAGLLALMTGAGLAAPAPGATQGGQSGDLIALAALMPMSEDEFSAAQAGGEAHLSALDEAAPGDTVFFGLFAAGFERRDGAVRLHCRVTFTTPDGWTQPVSDAPCVSGPFEASPSDAYLVLGFDFAVPAGLAGRQLIVTAEVRDELSGDAVPLAITTPIRIGGADE